MKKEIVFIVNPTSGNGKGKTYFKQLQLILKEKKINYKFAFSEYHQHIFTLVPTFIKNNYKKFIAVGGDGTINEIINAIIKTDENNLNLYFVGIVPIGTGNDWAKTMKIKNNNTKIALEVILKNNIIEHNVGMVYDIVNNKKNYFLNIVGFGLDGIICKKLFDRRIKKKKRINKFWYYTAVIKNFLSYNATTVNLKFDELNFQKRITFVAIAICKFYGNGLMPAKNANPTNNKFKLTIVAEVSTFGLLNKLRNLFKGNIDHYKEVEKYNTINVEASSKKNIYIQADGEYFGTLPANFSILKNKINVYSNTKTF